MLENKVKSCIAEIDQLREEVQQDDILKGGNLSIFIRAIMEHEDIDPVDLLSDIAGRFVKRHADKITKAAKIGEKLGEGLS